MQQTLHRLASIGQPASQWSEIPGPIRERLAGENVRTAADWLRLGKRRFQVFGITKAMARELDAIARGEQ